MKLSILTVRILLSLCFGMPVRIKLTKRGSKLEMFGLLEMSSSTICRKKKEKQFQENYL